MTLQLTAGRIQGKGHTRVGGRPTPGTKLREHYDALRRGERIHISHGQNYHAQLRNRYGMELRSKRGPGGYTELIGEWDGGVFLTLDRILEISLEEEL